MYIIYAKYQQKIQVELQCGYIFQQYASLNQQSQTIRVVWYIHLSILSLHLPFKKKRQMRVNIPYMDPKYITNKNMRELPTCQNSRSTFPEETFRKSSFKLLVMEFTKSQSADAKDAVWELCFMATVNPTPQHTLTEIAGHFTGSLTIWAEV